MLPPDIERSDAAARWPPRIGEPLPRATECWYEPAKFEGWILAPHGHGPEWERVFGVTGSDREHLWQALSAAAVDAAIIEVRDRTPNGIACGVKEAVALKKRSAVVVMSWHYASPTAAPRLATAYPSP